MIRSANATDACWITELWNSVIADTLITFTTLGKSETEIAEMIATQPVLVLRGAGGFATYSSFRSGPGYAATAEHTVMLDEKEQGRGYGRALMMSLMDVARTENKHAMIGGISGANPKAVAFHAALGFSQVGRMPEVGFKAGQWLDLILMQKLLNAPYSATTTG